MGIGVLYVNNDRMKEMIPYQSGGGMIMKVEKQNSTWADGPHKFEAGTPAVAEAAGLAAAIKYVSKIGIEKIHQHESSLTEYALDRLANFDDIEIYGPQDSRYRRGVISFNITGNSNPQII